MDLLQEIWQYKIQIIPIVLGIIIYEIPALIRRLKKTYYVPIYFSVYPFRQINQDLSEYLGEDHFYGGGYDLTDDETEKLRKKIIWVSVISGTLDAIIIPLLVGFIFAFFLSEELFFQFLVVLFVYKAILIIFSLKNSHSYFLENKGKITLLFVVYAFYLGIMIEMLKTSYYWAEPFITKGEWSLLWNSFSSVIFGKIAVSIVIFSVLVTLFSNYIADRKIRKRNIDYYE